jgi:hypothetical protein
MSELYRAVVAVTADQAAAVLVVRVVDGEPVAEPFARPTRGRRGPEARRRRAAKRAERAAAWLSK